MCWSRASWRRLHSRMDRSSLNRSTVAVLVCFGLTGLACGGREEARECERDPRVGIEQRSDAKDDASEQKIGSEGSSPGAEARGEDGRQGASSSQSSSKAESRSGSTSSSQTQVGPGAKVKTFTGSGTNTISFEVENPSRLAWTNSEGQPFSVRGERLSIDSRAGRGEVELEPGRYREVEVRGDAWTIIVQPR